MFSNFKSESETELGRVGVELLKTTVLTDQKWETKQDPL